MDQGKQSTTKGGGWSLRKKGEVYQVRFRLEGQRFELSTGARDLRTD